MVHACHRLVSYYYLFTSTPGPVMIMKTYLMYMYNHLSNHCEVVNTCQPHRVHIVALQVKYLLCAKATTRECVGRVAEREKLLARKLPVLQYDIK